MPKPIVYRRPARTRGSRGGRLPKRERPAEEYSAEEEARIDELIDRRFSAIANNLRRRGLFNAIITMMDPTHVPVIEGPDWTPDCPDWQPYCGEHGDPDPAEERSWR